MSVDVDVDVDADSDADAFVGKVVVRALGETMIGMKLWMGVASVGV